ncbi:MAG: hypothetical protein QF535_19030, partial [Anaerolineales bacterium]|nr:hypothetical protein [Anaerolineales bacterium]
MMALVTSPVTTNEITAPVTLIKKNDNEKGWIIDYPELFRDSGLQGYKIFLDRYTLKAPKGELFIGDMVLATVNRDPSWPQKEIGLIVDVVEENKTAIIELMDGEYVTIEWDLVSKPLELHPYAVKQRVAKALCELEESHLKEDLVREFEDILFDYFIPGGRILA